MFSPAPFWSKIPFFRLLLPLMGGILLQWYGKIAFTSIYYIGAASLILFLSAQFFSLNTTFRFGWITGLLANILFASLGAFLACEKDIRNHKSWVGHHCNDCSFIVVRIDEPLIKKENSFKANAVVTHAICHGNLRPVSGKIIVYFKTDSVVSKLKYGSTIFFNKPLQEIRNTGNPGAFDYKQYCLFNGITHQVYLAGKDFTRLPNYLVVRTFSDQIGQFLVTAREKTIAVLRKYIPSPKELGLGEALLMGYKDDLDKGLLQSYTNTGVVHIIAISGQHLALIYWLLLRILSPLGKTKGLKQLNTVIILSLLWLFSLITGAQPSILRAALMCTIMLLADVLSRRSNTLNSLACSAFVLLCINPFNLWDIGFQLSYLALISLVLFTRPIYALVSLNAKALGHIWQLLSASIAAQILTAPISIYHFHQFPFSFILTNLLAVPLSSLVLIGELLLFVLSFLPVLGMIVGKLLTVSIWLMNTWVERVEGLQWLLWDGLQITWIQTLLLYLTILGLSIWFLKELKRFLWMAIGASLLFLTLRSYSFHSSNQQRRFIVYNVSKHTAIDVVDGRRFFFIGDSELSIDGPIRNFNIKPARTLFRMKSIQYVDQGDGTSFDWFNKRIVVANGSEPVDTKRPIDFLVLSRGSGSIDFDAHFVRQAVLDGSIPFWQAKQLKAQFNQLHIPCHDVTTDGAFIYNLK
jgi:competence protein ComEC